MSSSTPGGPIGRRLLPHAVDDIAHYDPSKVWAFLPNKVSKGWEDITYESLARAVNRLAWFVEGKLGRATAGQFPTVCYIGKPDMRYFVMEMAAAKTGYKVGHAHLMHSLACSRKLN